MSPRRVPEVFLYASVQSPLMDRVNSASDNCIRCVRRPIIKTESVDGWQEFHILDERTPTTSIVLSTATAIGMNLTCLEHHYGISSYILRFLLTGKSIIHTEGVRAGQQLLAHLAT